MHKKQHTWIIEHNYKEKAKESEQRMQRLFDNITRELLNEYPHLLDNNENITKTG